MRRRKKDRHLPPCVYLKHGAYWLVKNNRWVRLGTDLPSVLSTYGRRVTGTKSEIGAIFDKVLAHIKPTLAANTYRQYSEANERLKSILAEFTPGEVMGKHIAAIKLSYSKTPPMGNRILSVAKVFFGQLVEWQLIDSNPCIGVKGYKESGRERYITEAEFKAIYTHAGHRLRVIMDLQYLTGQRIGDVLAIKAEDVTEQGIYFTQKKTKAKILLRWTPELREVVDRARGLYGNARPLRTLLMGRRGKAPDYSTTYEQFKNAAKLAGVEDARPNDLRARSITDVSNEGGDATGLAGHTNPQMTKRYIRNRKAKEVSGPSIRQASKSGGVSR